MRQLYKGPLNLEPSKISPSNFSCFAVGGRRLKIDAATASLFLDSQVTVCCVTPHTAKLKQRRSIDRNPTTKAQGYEVLNAAEVDLVLEERAPNPGVVVESVLEGFGTAGQAQHPEAKQAGQRVCKVCKKGRHG